MGVRLYSDSASGRLAADIIPADTSITLEPGQGLTFPTPSGGDWAILSLEDSSGAKEKVKLTGLAGDILTVERGQEGDTALPFLAGSRCELRLTASSFGDLPQKSGDEVIVGEWIFNQQPLGVGFDDFAQKSVNEDIGGQWTFQDLTTFAGLSQFDAAATFASTSVFNNQATFNGPTQFVGVISGPGTDVFARLADGETVTGIWNFSAHPIFDAGATFNADVGVNGKVITSGEGTLTGSPDNSVLRMKALTQAAYNAIAKDPLTLYFITS